MSLRKVVFWLHLFSGLIAGLVIAVMSFTGAVLAFENEIVGWAERDVRRIEAPAATTVLRLDEILAKARAAAPEGSKPSGVTVSRDPREAVAVNFGRDGGVYYVNQYTGAVIKPASERTHDFMHLMVDWHRWLALSGDNRPLGKAVTGACNLAFLFLALSGLWLWWPRAWNARILRPSLWFVRGASGKARDWNWHNVIGFWSLPVLIVLTVSGSVIGYRWAGNLVYRLAGETPPAQGTAAPAADYKIERPEGAKKTHLHGSLRPFSSRVPLLGNHHSSRRSSAASCRCSRGFRHHHSRGFRHHHSRCRAPRSLCNPAGFASARQRPPTLQRHRPRIRPLVCRRVHPGRAPSVHRRVA
jgi:uncharacterized iron-regulated membrane protein